MDDGLRHRSTTPLSDSEIQPDVEPIEMIDEDTYLRESMATTCKWCPLLTISAILVYMHGVALGWYLCSK